VKALGWAGLFLASAAVLAAPAKSSTGTADELRRATQELMTAVASGDWAVWERYLDDSISYTAEDGRTLTKAQLRDRRDGRDLVWTRAAGKS
jgi:hypothetical protein